jgi:putative SOS response-associated peptidase YedK
MPRGVLQGEPERLGVPPYARSPDELCLTFAAAPGSGETVPMAMRWGLFVPASPKQRRLHLRVDQILGRWAARHSRCLLPVGGYTQRGKRNSRIAVTVAEDLTLAIAGVWESGWPAPAFAVVTTEANEALAPAMQRMPVLLPPELWPLWLSGAPLSIADVALLERPAPSAWLRARATRGAVRTGKDAPDEGALSVRQQLRNLAPGLDLWEPPDRRRGLAAQPEASLALG